MTSGNPRWVMPCAVALGAVAALAQLVWEHTHGGILRHHLLNDASMPAVSNLWGLVLLPLLGWLAGWAVARRAEKRCGRFSVSSLAGFVGALMGGAALSIAFVTGGEAAATQVMLALLVASVALPAYRAEYLFGFVMAMTFKFGPVLPALAFSLPMLISGVSRLLIWPVAKWLRGQLRSSQPA